MKKKIIFMVINMNIGGTEKALLNMIAEMPGEKYDITILMLEKFGGFLELIPEHVQVKYIEGYKEIKGILNNPPLSSTRSIMRKGEISRAVSIFSLHLLSKITKERRLFFKYVLKNIADLQEEYDVAIAYAGPMDFISYFVLEKIEAKKKIQWIHFDITKIGFNHIIAAKLYSRFDQIFVVSKEGKEKLINSLPKMKHKIECSYNIVSTNQIIRMANQGTSFEDKFAGMRILTVGRLSKEKGQDLTIHVLANLKEKGYNVRWYCIGEGAAREEYEKLIQHYDLESDFILLGAKANPYPFIKNCDLYVQPSRHEGYCITLAEAKCFNKPIITTNFTGAYEQIEHNNTGLIVEFDEAQLYKAVETVINNQTLRSHFSTKLADTQKFTSNNIGKSLPI